MRRIADVTRKLVSGFRKPAEKIGTGRKSPANRPERARAFQAAVNCGFKPDEVEVIFIALTAVFTAIPTTKLGGSQKSRDDRTASFYQQLSRQGVFASAKRAGLNEQQLAGLLALVLAKDVEEKDTRAWEDIARLARLFDKLHGLSAEQVTALTAEVIAQNGLRIYAKFFKDLMNYYKNNALPDPLDPKNVQIIVARVEIFGLGMGESAIRLMPKEF